MNTQSVSHIYKVKKLTKKQEHLMSKTLGCCRFVWNYFLDLNLKRLENKEWVLNYIDMSKLLTLLKKDEQYYYLNEVPSTTLIQQLKDLDTAFKRFFDKKLKANKPKFKKRAEHNSARFQMDQRHINKTFIPEEVLKLPIIGNIKLIWDYKPSSKPKMVTVSRTPAGEFTVSMMCEEHIVHFPKTNKIVGIDVGIKDIIVTSDGLFSGSCVNRLIKIENIRKKLQKKLSLKTKGSGRYNKKRQEIAKLYQKEANIRKDFTHKLTHYLVKNYDVICIETLSLKDMLKNKRISRVLSRANLGEMVRQLEYKTKWYGKKLIRVGRYYPSTKTCSNCGEIQNMKLSDRIMNCECGLVMDRDLNASINILRQGVKVSQKATNELVAFEACVAVSNLIHSDEVELTGDVMNSITHYSILKRDSVKATKIRMERLLVGV